MGDSVEVLQEKATKFMLLRKRKGRQSIRRGKRVRSKYLLINLKGIKENSGGIREGALTQICSRLGNN